uniref:V-type proton ATPase subunit a n=1 Tax=Caenorhabditis tropicalis TaxID=1561998 RepID=A0A1I7TU45_9PELO
MKANEMIEMSLNQTEKSIDVLREGDLCRRLTSLELRDMHLSYHEDFLRLRQMIDTVEEQIHKESQSNSKWIDRRINGAKATADQAVKKREQNLGKMVEELVDKILEDDGDFHVLFAIKDESGHRKSVEGTGVETKETRHFEMNSFGNMIELSRINTTVACVDARTDKKEDESTVEEEDTVDGVDSKFNSCLKQEKALSPMKIL